MQRILPRGVRGLYFRTRFLGSFAEGLSPSRCGYEPEQGGCEAAGRRGSRCCWRGGWRRDLLRGRRRQRQQQAARNQLRERWYHKRRHPKWQRRRWRRWRR